MNHLLRSSHLQHTTSVHFWVQQSLGHRCTCLALKQLLTLTVRWLLLPAWRLDGMRGRQLRWMTSRASARLLLLTSNCSLHFDSSNYCLWKDYSAALCLLIYQVVTKRVIRGDVNLLVILARRQLKMPAQLRERGQSCFRPNSMVMQCRN